MGGGQAMHRSPACLMHALHAAQQVSSQVARMVTQGRRVDAGGGAGDIDALPYACCLTNSRAVPAAPHPSSSRKVDLPRAMLSEAPMRVNTASIACMRTEAAGTYEPT